MFVGTASASPSNVSPIVKLPVGMSAMPEGRLKSTSKLVRGGWLCWSVALHSDRVG